MNAPSPVFKSVELLTGERLTEAWSECSPLLQRALDTSPIPRSAEDCLVLIRNHRLDLLVGYLADRKVAAILLVGYFQEKSGTVAHIQAAAGPNISRALVEWGDVVAWLKAKGVYRVQLFCQPAQERLWRMLGFTTVYRVMSVPI